jgi:hypothetical protein
VSIVWGGGPVWGAPCGGRKGGSGPGNKGSTSTWPAEARPWWAHATRGWCRPTRDRGLNGRLTGWSRLLCWRFYPSQRIQIYSNPSKFAQSKRDFPCLRKFEIKYGFEGFEERNNFLYRNFFRFIVDFE